MSTPLRLSVNLLGNGITFNTLNCFPKNDMPRTAFALDQAILEDMDIPKDGPAKVAGELVRDEGRIVLKDLIAKASPKHQPIWMAVRPLRKFPSFSLTFVATAAIHFTAPSNPVFELNTMGRLKLNQQPSEHAKIVRFFPEGLVTDWESWCLESFVKAKWRTKMQSRISNALPTISQQKDEVTTCFDDIFNVLITLRTQYIRTMKVWQQVQGHWNEKDREAKRHLLVALMECSLRPPRKPR